jgi:hypothetical protein
MKMATKRCVAAAAKMAINGDGENVALSREKHRGTAGWRGGGGGSRIKRQWHLAKKPASIENESQRRRSENGRGKAKSQRRRRRKGENRRQQRQQKP